MASKNDSEDTRADKLAARRAAERDVLLREVDEAVRQDEVATVMRRYGVPIGIGLVLVLGAFGGWIWWSRHSESQLERQSESLVIAYDSIEAGDREKAKRELQPIAADGGPAASASARLALAAIAIEENRTADAIREFAAVADDADAPQPYRDLATLRMVTVQFEDLPPQQVVDRLKPLAVPGNPWFGSAGEVVAMAYLKQNREDLAGPLLASIAKDETVPGSIRSRTRQLAGLLGVDAVEDVDETLADMREREGAVAAAAQ